MNEAARSRVERALDLASRLASRLPLSKDAQIVVSGLFGYVKQIARSRALRRSRA